MYLLVKFQLGLKRQNKHNEDTVLYLGDAEKTHNLLATDQLCVFVCAHAGVFMSLHVYNQVPSMHGPN